MGIVEKKYLKKIDFSEYEKLEVLDTETSYIGNQRCHFNCLSYFRLNRSEVKHICAVLQRFNRNVVLHYIIELKNGVFIDPTYGNITDACTSYHLYKRYNPTVFDCSEIQTDKRELYLKYIGKYSFTGMVHSFVGDFNYGI